MSKIITLESIIQIPRKLGVQVKVDVQTLGHVNGIGRICSACETYWDGPQDTEEVKSDIIL